MFLLLADCTPPESSHQRLTHFKRSDSPVLVFDLDGTLVLRTDKITPERFTATTPKGFDVACVKIRALDGFTLDKAYRLVPEFEDLVAHLRDTGLKFGIMTHAPHSVSRALQHAFPAFAELLNLDGFLGVFSGHGALSQAQMQWHAQPHTVGIRCDKGTTFLQGSLENKFPSYRFQRTNLSAKPLGAIRETLSLRYSTPVILFDDRWVNRDFGSTNPRDMFGLVSRLLWKAIPDPNRTTIEDVDFRTLTPSELNYEIQEGCLRDRVSQEMAAALIEHASTVLLTTMQKHGIMHGSAGVLGAEPDSHGLRRAAIVYGGQSARLSCGNAALDATLASKKFQELVSSGVAGAARAHEILQPGG